MSTDRHAEEDSARARERIGVLNCVSPEVAFRILGQPALVQSWLGSECIAPMQLVDCALFVYYLSSTPTCNNADCDQWPDVPRTSGDIPLECKGHMDVTHKLVTSHMRLVAAYALTLDELYNAYLIVYKQARALKKLKTRKLGSKQARQFHAAHRQNLDALPSIEGKVKEMFLRLENVLTYDAVRDSSCESWMADHASLMLSIRSHAQSKRDADTCAHQEIMRCSKLPAFATDEEIAHTTDTLDRCQDAELAEDIREIISFMTEQHKAFKELTTKYSSRRGQIKVPTAVQVLPSVSTLALLRCALLDKFRFLVRLLELSVVNAFKVHLPGGGACAWLHPRLITEVMEVADQAKRSTACTCDIRTKCRSYLVALDVERAVGEYDQSAHSCCPRTTAKRGPCGVPALVRNFNEVMDTLMKDSFSRVEQAQTRALGAYDEALKALCKAEARLASAWRLAEQRDAKPMGWQVETKSEECEVIVTHGDWSDPECVPVDDVEVISDEEKRQPRATECVFCHQRRGPGRHKDPIVLRKCDGCHDRRMRFCSKGCYSEYWYQTHKYHCDELRQDPMVCCLQVCKNPIAPGDQPETTFTCAGVCKGDLEFLVFRHCSPLCAQDGEKRHKLSCREC